MRKHKSNVCHDYERRINDEIAAGAYSADLYLKKSLESVHITPDGKKSIGIPESVHLTMYDIQKKAIDILPRMRFMYLLSLLEALFQDYICERDNINIDQIKSHLKNETSNWSKISNNQWC